jgi:hypothetical protein
MAIATGVAAYWNNHGQFRNLREELIATHIGLQLCLFLLSALAST